MLRDALMTLMIISLTALSFVSFATADETRLLVLAGAATRPVLEEAAPRIEQQLGIKLVLDFGGSGALLSRLELTQRGDIYLPASDDYIDMASARGLIDPESVVSYAWLRPALLVRRGNPRGIHALSDLSRVRAAIGEPRTVCIGLFADEILTRANLRNELMPRLGRARSVASLGNLLLVGSVDAIIAWRVLAAWYPEQIEVVELPAELIPRLARIPGTVTSFSTNATAARRVLTWLASDAGQELWRRHGYFTGEGAARDTHDEQKEGVQEKNTQGKDLQRNETR